VLNLPHDWSIEGEFSEKNPGDLRVGALPRHGLVSQAFTLPASNSRQTVFIDSMVSIAIAKLD